MKALVPLLPWATPRPPDREKLEPGAWSPASSELPVGLFCEVSCSRENTNCNSTLHASAYNNHSVLDHRLTYKV